MNIELEWDYAIADSADVPHVSLMRNGEVYLSLPYSLGNGSKVEELAVLLNNRG